MQEQDEIERLRDVIVYQTERIARLERMLDEARPPADPGDTGPLRYARLSLERMMRNEWPFIRLVFTRGDVEGMGYRFASKEAWGQFVTWFENGAMELIVERTWDVLQDSCERAIELSAGPSNIISRIPDDPEEEVA